MKIPDSIRKRAEESADLTLEKAEGYSVGMLAVMRLFMIDAYTQCYLDLMAGEPDYYVVKMNGIWQAGLAAQLLESLGEILADHGLDDARLKAVNGSIKPVKLLVMEEE